MGRRSRKRDPAPPDERRPAELGGAAPGPPASGARRPAVPSPRRRPRREEAPPAPWAPFPLVELCILVGIVLMIVGFVSSGSRGRLIAVLGIALVSLSALELTVREHFAGYRSHTSLLAMACAVVAVTLTYLALGAAPVVLLGVGLAAFAAAWSLLRAAFRRRTGGLTWRA